jgi:hypothetical protein
MIFINGQAAAYSIRCRIGKRDGTTVKYYLQTSKGTGEAFRVTRCSSVSPVVKSLAHPEDPYFAAACAHCANEVRNALAPAGGSISPVSDVLNGTMRP